MAGSEGWSYGVVTVRVSSLDRGVGPAAPLAERAGVQPDVVAAGKDELLRDHRGGDTGAAVHGDLVRLRRTRGERLSKNALRAPGMRPATGSSGSTSPRQRSGAAGVVEHEGRIAEAREDLVRLDDVVRANAGDEGAPGTGFEPAPGSSGPA